MPSQMDPDACWNNISTCVLYYAPHLTDCSCHRKAPRIDKHPIQFLDVLYLSLPTLLKWAKFLLPNFFPAYHTVCTACTVSRTESKSWTKYAKYPFNRLSSRFPFLRLPFFALVVLPSTCNSCRHRFSWFTPFVAAFWHPEFCQRPVFGILFRTTVCYLDCAPSFVAWHITKVCKFNDRLQICCKCCGRGRRCESAPR